MCPVGPSLGHLGAVGWQPTGLNVSCWTEFGASWGCMLALLDGAWGRMLAPYTSVPSPRKKCTMMKNDLQSQVGKQETSINTGWSHASPACFPTVASLGVDFDRLRAEKGRRSTWAMLQSCTVFSETHLDFKLGFGEMHNHIIMSSCPCYRLAASISSQFQFLHPMSTPMPILEHKITC